MRVPMIATRDMTYATRQLKADDAFDASRSDARLLAALGRAKLVEEATEPKADEDAPAKPKRRTKKKSRD